LDVVDVVDVVEFVTYGPDSLGFGAAFASVTAPFGARPQRTHTLGTNGELNWVQRLRLLTEAESPNPGT
jgi:hypothetical protein